MSAASRRQVLVRSGIARGAARTAGDDADDADEAAVGALANAASDAPPAKAPRHLSAVSERGAPPTAPRDAARAKRAEMGPDTLGHLPAPATSATSERVSSAIQISPAVIAGLVFGICGVLASATVQHTLASFAKEGGVNPIIFLAVPGLFAALFAIVAYQGARRKVTRMAQSFSRALLVALLTWASFSALATSVWCKPEHYGQCYSSFLIVSGLIGGGPMLLGAGLAGGVVGWLILRQRV